MAREHARIHIAIWRPDDDFRVRPASSQRLFFLILSQRELNNAGVIPLMISKWARCAPDTTSADVEKDLTDLAEHRLVLIDHDTEEVWIRSFLRRDEVMKHPYMRRSALRAVEQIESPMLRREAAAELRRIGHPDGVEVASRLDPAGSPTTRRDAIGSGSPTTRPDGIESGSPTTRRDGIESGTATTRGGRGGGRGSGSVPSVGGSGGGSRAGERPGGREAPPPAPNLDPDNPRCGQHAHIPATERGPDCRACRAVRLELEAAPDPADAERAARRAAIDACDRCDDRGMREVGDELRPTRCDHAPATVGAGP